MPRVSQDQLEARRQEILAGARVCFARHGYEGATVRRLEEETGLSRGAIFHHFRDKESLFLAVAEDDAAAMVATVARNGLVQVMRDLLDRAGTGEDESVVAGWLGTQLEVSRRLRTDPEFAKRWAARADAIAAATRDRLTRQLEAGTLRSDVDRSPCSPSSSSSPTTASSCTWRRADPAPISNGSSTSSRPPSDGDGTITLAATCGVRSQCQLDDSRGRLRWP